MIMPPEAPLASKTAQPMKRELQRDLMNRRSTVEVLVSRRMTMEGFVLAKKPLINALFFGDSRPRTFQDKIIIEEAATRVSPQ